MVSVFYDDFTSKLTPKEKNPAKNTSWAKKMVIS